MFTKTLLILLMANKVSFWKSGREGALYDENVMTHSAVLATCQVLWDNCLPRQ